jgi:hypothetical protein
MAADIALATAIFGNEDLLKGIHADSDNLDVEESTLGRDVFLRQEESHPVDKFVENVLRKDAGIADSSWDAPIAAAPIKKADMSETGSLAKRLGIVRTEQKIIDGEPWSYAYNAAGEVVDARLVRASE